MSLAPAPPIVIALVGAGSVSPDVAEIAREAGEAIARRGALLICGGLGGVMEAGCRGAKEAGGVTIGLLPGDDPALANQWVTVPLATGLGHARNALIARSCHGMIAVAGETGTLSEIALALKMGKPVVAVRSVWGDLPGVTPVDNAVDGVDRLFAMIGAEGAAR